LELDAKQCSSLQAVAGGYDRAMKPTSEAMAEARNNPDGWVYVVVGDYDPDGAVPSEAIAGAWKVDVNGEIVGDFIPNPKYTGPPPK
jgi:hypothetical protein